MTKKSPSKSGLYDPQLEKDSCGVGFVCNIKGRPNNQILRDAHQMNCAMEHRGGVGFEARIVCLQNRQKVYLINQILSPGTMVPVLFSCPTMNQRSADA